MLTHTAIDCVGGTYYVRGALSGETCSPPYTDRGATIAKAEEIEALPADERAAVLAGRRPAPGCVWLVGGRQEPWKFCVPHAAA